MTVDEAREILGVKVGVSFDEIRVAYLSEKNQCGQGVTDRGVNSEGFSAAR